jgi:hypothetical protein
VNVNLRGDAKVRSEDWEQDGEHRLGERVERDRKREGEARKQTMLALSDQLRFILWDAVSETNNAKKHVSTASVSLAPEGTVACKVREEGRQWIGERGKVRGEGEREGERGESTDQTRRHTVDGYRQVAEDVQGDGRRQAACAAEVHREVRSAELVDRE